MSASTGSEWTEPIPFGKPSPRPPDSLATYPVGLLPRHDLVVYYPSAGAVTIIVGVPAPRPCDPRVPYGAKALARLRFRSFAQIADVDDLQQQPAPTVPDDRHRAFPDEATS